MIRVAFLGDISFVGQYDLSNNPNAYDRFSSIAKILKGYDYVIGNLECPLTNKNKTLVCKSMHIKSNPINVKLLKYLNIDAVNLSNNHINDFGKEGIQDTIKTLEDNNIKWFGLNSKDLLINIKGEKIVVGSFCCYSTNATNYSKKGVTPLNFKNVKFFLENKKYLNFLKIMNFHWGEEHTNYPRPTDKSFIKRINDNYENAIIIGHHTHTIQPIVKNKCIIYYGLGNFCFDNLKSIDGKSKLKQNLDNKKGIIAELSIQNNKVIKSNEIFINEVNNTIIKYDLNNEIYDINNSFNNLNKDDYILLRNKQIKKNRSEKFGKKNKSWYLSKINYYAIGAFILRKINDYKYNKNIK